MSANIARRSDLSRDEILEWIRHAMTEMFTELPPEAIVPSARLVEDLDLDSIDAVDLTVRMQSITGIKVDEDELRALRTVGDVVRLAEQHLARSSLRSVAR
jgi:acyl carrier protein